jgi:hypothetical protein
MNVSVFIQKIVSHTHTHTLFIQQWSAHYRTNNSKKSLKIPKGNQNPYIAEQSTQRPKEKGQNIHMKLKPFRNNPFLLRLDLNLLDRFFIWTRNCLFIINCNLLLHINFFIWMFLYLFRKLFAIKYKTFYLMNP